MRGYCGLAGKPHEADPQRASVDGLVRSSETAPRPAGFIEPAIPTLVDKPPAGPAWIHVDWGQSA